MVRFLLEINGEEVLGGARGSCSVGEGLRRGLAASCVGDVPRVIKRVLLVAEVLCSQSKEHEEVGIETAEGEGEEEGYGDEF